MKSFLYDPKFGSIVETDGRRLVNSTKPIFSFGFTELRYDGAIRTVKLDDESRDLTDDEVTELDGFIDSIVVNESVSVQWDINVNQRLYLTNTDWYVTRFAETGIEIPAEIIAKRAEARSAIIALDSVV